MFGTQLPSTHQLPSNTTRFRNSTGLQRPRHLHRLCFTTRRGHLQRMIKRATKAALSSDPKGFHITIHPKRKLGYSLRRINTKFKVISVKSIKRLFTEPAKVRISIIALASVDPTCRHCTLMT